MPAYRKRQRGIYTLYNKVCQKSAAHSTAVPVGADRIRPNVMGTARFGEWNQRPVAVLGFPRGEAKGQKTYAFTTQRTAQSRQLRADSVRIYGYAAYHCGNLQVSFLKLHLSGNGDGER